MLRKVVCKNICVLNMLNNEFPILNIDLLKINEESANITETQLKVHGQSNTTNKIKYKNLTRDEKSKVKKG